jgi:FkbM family methyltransferase
MFEKLSILKSKGYEPDVIFDIGAHQGTWAAQMKQLYPSARYILFDGIVYPHIQHYFGNDPNVKFFNLLLNETMTEVDWYEEKNSGDSFFKERTHHFSKSVPQKRATVDLETVSQSCHLTEGAKNIFMKIDCQGAEIPILKGAKSVLEKVDFIVLEMPFFGQYNEGVPGFLEHIQFMDSIGFIPFDIVDTHYVNNYNMQVDILFINKKHPFNKDVQDKLM